MLKPSEEQAHEQNSYLTTEILNAFITYWHNLWSVSARNTLINLVAEKYTWLFIKLEKEMLPSVILTASPVVYQKNIKDRYGH